MTRPQTTFGQFRYAVVFLSLFFLYIQLSGCSGDADGGAGRANERLVPVVEAVQAKYGSLPLNERLNGAVKAKNQVELYPQISAEIVHVYVQNGDQVKFGEPLLRLRDTEFREQVKQAEANYQIASAQAKQAEAEMQRIQGELRRGTSLSEKQLISPTEFEALQTQAIAAEADAELAQARVKQAQAIVDQRKEELSRTIVRAPVDGTIGSRNAEIGMLVTPNTRIFTLGKLDSVRVEIILTDNMLSYIKENQRSEISSQILPFGSIEATVARISPFLHPITHSTIAEIDLPNPGGALKPGMFVTVDIFYGESEQATLVPVSALWENSVTTTVGVFVSRDSLTGEPGGSVDGPYRGSLTGPASFQFIPVDVVAKGRMAAGVRGIDPGNWIVTIGQDLLGADSSRAKVRPVNWDWVEELQRLQREDLLQETIQRQQTTAADSSLIGILPTGGEIGL